MHWEHLRLATKINFPFVLYKVPFKLCRMRLGGVQLGGGGSPGKTLGSSVDSLVAELLPVSSVEFTSTRLKAYSIRRSWLYSGMSAPKDLTVGTLTGNSLRSARSTGLDLTGNVNIRLTSFGYDLPSLETDSKVGNVGGLGLTGSVRGHDTPSVGLSELNAAS